MNCNFFHTHLATDPQLTGINTSVHVQQNTSRAPEIQDHFPSAPSYSDLSVLRLSLSLSFRCPRTRSAPAPPPPPRATATTKRLPSPPPTTASATTWAQTCQSTEPPGSVKQSHNLTIACQYNHLSLTEIRTCLSLCQPKCVFDPLWDCRLVSRQR